MEVTQEQVQKFQAAATEFQKSHPDFCAPDVLYTILTDEKEQAALHVANGERVNDARAVDRVRRIHSRIKRHDTFKTITQNPDEVEAYLAQRREDRRSGKRR